MNFFTFVFARDDQGSQSKAHHKKVTFNLTGDEDSEGEDINEILGRKAPNSEKSELKSSFEKRQEKVMRFQVLHMYFDTH